MVTSPTTTRGAVRAFARLPHPAFAVLAAALPAQSPASRAASRESPPASRPAFVARIDTLGQGFVDQRKAPGVAIAVIAGGSTLLRGYGHRGDAAHTPIGADTVFEIGSITKAFTGILVATLVADHTVRLDETLRAFVPKDVGTPVGDGAAITLIDLATHTSRLPRLPGNLRPRDPTNPYAGYTQEQLFEAIGDVELRPGLGTVYEYSNLGAGLLGVLLARRTGTDYAQLLDARVLQPLGLTDTAITLRKDQEARLALPHNAAQRRVRNWDLAVLAAAGALRSTIADMAHLARTCVDDAATPVRDALNDATTARRDTDLPGTRVGLFWHVSHRDDVGGDLVWHNGGTGGYRSFFGFSRARRVAVVVLANSANEVEPLADAVLRTALKVK